MITLADLPLRADLVGQEPYGAPQLQVPVVLNVNENPYPPSPLIRHEMAAALVTAAGTLNRYPDREATQLRADLARYLGHGLTADRVWAANGSNEIMAHLLTAFGGPGRRMLTFTPSYSMYPEYARNTCTEFVTVPRRADFGLDAGLVLDAIRETEPTVVVIATPNNPTGTVVGLDVIDEVCSGTEAIVVVDEAYQEFSSGPSALELLDRHPRLVVSRTMSKAFALAGGRVGYLAADAAIVDACRIVRLPYHLSAQTQAVARVALAHADELLAQVRQLAAEARGFEAWAKGRGYAVIDSQANFTLIGRFADRHQVWQDLLDRGILIRETGPDGYLRVSAGTPEEMAALRAALDDLLPTIEGTTP
ncbi:histidinol-phosphate transaminase [Tessaracoccus lapidicaptus]|uniref:Histidinol-phosphate aminotransferase n=1 Tax=Tessaracoccus lapidicaptus TaxID=1427523 RepID=A0A1C0AN19_9ACTN|nr:MULTISPECIES: histidinol-phosphate transaminase [Tessaracoccus]AQX14676.1 histidinol-phosphate transaminase [Tessaracoccus sp. T2.5-30]OCL34664.1 histidinol-phosphate transaminase [Tessaracoccus lapidicaptus]VEP38740.1 Histidinol-phosphate aminotransferase [Tessaracoccus lapidicaptus]